MIYRLIYADEFEAKICTETQLSIEDMTTVLRGLRECRRVEYEQECSVCRERIRGAHGTNFCPNCGANIRGEK